MELTFYTDYALRVLIYAGLCRDRLCLISEIAEHYAISRNHLTKVVHGLARGGFVQTHRGKSGGLALARSPQRSVLATWSGTWKAPSAQSNVSEPATCV